jgi:hypothetical protein
MHKLLTEILNFKGENTKALVSTITDNVFFYEQFHEVAKTVKVQVYLPKQLCVECIYLLTSSSALYGTRQSRNSWKVMMKAGSKNLRGIRGLERPYISCI